MLKPSKYYIPVEIDDKIALFQTLTSSVVKIDRAMFSRIFEEGDLRTDPDAVAALESMGFLTQHEDEDFRLTALRRQYKSADTGVQSAIIAVTMECNARCYYCYENGATRAKMTLPTADAVVDFLDSRCKTRKLVIQWFGGEPLCAVDIIDHIATCLRDRGIQLSGLITTNGLLIEDDILEKASGLWGIKRFQIPVDALGADYDRIKNYKDIPAGESAFNRLTGNIHKVLQRGFHVNARINFDPGNIAPAIDVLHHLAREFSHYPNFFAYAAPLTGKNIPSIVDLDTKGRMHPYLQLLLEMRRLGFLTPTLLKEECYYGGDESLSGLSLASRPTGCYATLPNVFAIDQNGDLYKCHRLLGRGQNYTCGNVFSGVEYNKTLRFFCDDQPCYPECADCALMPICQGGCKVKQKWYGGHAGCLAIRDIVKDVIRCYVAELSARS